VLKAAALKAKMSAAFQIWGTAMTADLIFKIAVIGLGIFSTVLMSMLILNV